MSHEEQFDLLTPEGLPTGKRKARSLVHRDGDWHEAVHIWLFNSKGEVLLQKRSQCKDCYPGCWDISSAGHIPAGETPILASHREFEEELGLEMDRIGELHFIDRVASVSHPTPTFLNREWQDVYWIAGDVPLSQFRLQASELEAVRYVPVSEVLRAAREQDPSFTPMGGPSYRGVLEELARIGAQLATKGAEEGGAAAK
ncbi:putative nudix hydrolase 3 [Paratrimastix pyriformis]|uniref:Nudix hydrolase 3 n=1 Tax=Paratrimastix pyriformis TaxID=342808 RepID=A0ABQ8UWA5_9EUKA|nr:putative nudix hydrolase 3 [Paratrimastix pyriformis]